LESLLPESLGKLAELAGRWRDRVKHAVPQAANRRHFWQWVFSGPVASMVATGRDHEAQQAMEQQLATPEAQTSQGEVLLVGAGPGDAGLLTLRGLQVLQQADVVLYDLLVSEQVLDLVRRDAQKICVGKRAGRHLLPQDEINQLLISHAQQGKKVVRLKGGDPFIFGRGGEELQAVAAAGIPFQVVPGVTAAAGATAYAGIPLTHRDHAQSVTFLTGHCQPEGTRIDWPALAKGNQTLAIYMGTIKSAEISRQLILHGRAATTPVAVIGCGTRPEQQVLTGELQHLEQLARQAPAPALLVIGEVAALHHQLAWFGHSYPADGTASAAVMNLA
jgi:uroporphyrin-III C-methyltransferase/precorrin-2 dehydrogenase/sirohydrochlorin ferrochelatase